VLLRALSASVVSFSPRLPAGRQGDIEITEPHEPENFEKRKKTKEESKRRKN